MSLNRADLMRLAIAHREVADACEKMLKDEARHEFDVQHTQVSWKTPNIGKIESSLTLDAVTVTEPEMLLDYLQARYPDAIITKTKTVTTRTYSPAWQASVLADLQPMDPTDVKPGEATGCMDREGTVVPGVMWRRGGAWRQVAWTPNAGLRREYAQAAVAYLERGVPLPAVLSPLAVESPPVAVEVESA